MYIIMTMTICSALMSIVLMMINQIISKKKFKDREKSSPFECGFDPFQVAHSPFSIQFFMVGIMFLTFDIEIALLVPLAPAIKLMNIKWLITSMMFMLILMIGLMIEWTENSITWTD